MFIDKRLRAIVGIEISIVDLEGMLKARQDEALQGRHGMVRGLREENADEARSMADLVRGCHRDGCSRPIVTVAQGSGSAPADSITLP